MVNGGPRPLIAIAAAIFGFVGWCWAVLTLGGAGTVLALGRGSVRRARLSAIRGGSEPTNPWASVERAPVNRKIVDRPSRLGSKGAAVSSAVKCHKARAIAVGCCVACVAGALGADRASRADAGADDRVRRRQPPGRLGAQACSGTVEDFWRRTLPDWGYSYSKPASSTTATAPAATTGPPAARPRRGPERTGSIARPRTRSTSITGGSRACSTVSVTTGRAVSSPTSGPTGRRRAWARSSATSAASTTQTAWPGSTRASATTPGA